MPWRLQRIKKKRIGRTQVRRNIGRNLRTCTSSYGNNNCGQRSRNPVSLAPIHFTTALAGGLPLRAHARHSVGFENTISSPQSLKSDIASDINTNGDEGA